MSNYRIEPNSQNKQIVHLQTIIKGKVNDLINPDRISVNNKGFDLLKKLKDILSNKLTINNETLTIKYINLYIDNSIENIDCIGIFIWYDIKSATKRGNVLYSLVNHLNNEYDIEIVFFQYNFPIFIEYIFKAFKTCHVIHLAPTYEMYLNNSNFELKKYL